MALATFGTTTFDFPDVWGPGQRVRISTAEGSTVAIPAEDLLQFVNGAYVVPMRRIREETKDWRESLLG